LLCVPLNTIIIFYVYNKKWMNKIIALILILILLFIIILCYYNKIFFIIILLIISMLVFVLMLYIGNKNIKQIVKQYKLWLSILISIIIYYIKSI